LSNPVAAPSLPLYSILDHPIRIIQVLLNGLVQVDKLFFTPRQIEHLRDDQKTKYKI